MADDPPLRGSVTESYGGVIIVGSAVWLSSMAFSGGHVVVVVSVALVVSSSPLHCGWCAGVGAHTDSTCKNAY